MLKLAKAFDISPEELNFGALKYRDNEIMDSYAEISSLISIGWNPKWDLTSAIFDLAEKQLPLS